MQPFKAGVRLPFGSFLCSIVPEKNTLSCMNVVSQQTQTYKLDDALQSLDLPEDGKEMEKLVKDQLKPILLSLLAQRPKRKAPKAPKAPEEKPSTPMLPSTPIDDGIFEADLLREEVLSLKEQINDRDVALEAARSRIVELEANVQKCMQLASAFEESAQQVHEKSEEHVKQTRVRLNDCLEKEKDLQAALDEANSRVLSKEREIRGIQTELEQSEALSRESTAKRGEYEAGLRKQLSATAKKLAALEKKYKTLHNEATSKLEQSRVVVTQKVKDLAESDRLLAEVKKQLLNAMSEKEEEKSRHMFLLEQREKETETLRQQKRALEEEFAMSQAAMQRKDDVISSQKLQIEQLSSDAPTPLSTPTGAQMAKEKRLQAVVQEKEKQIAQLQANVRELTMVAESLCKELEEKSK